MVDEHALVPEGGGEGIVLLLGPGRPHHIIEEQAFDVVRGESGQLETRTVDDRFAESADLGVDGEGQDDTSVLEDWVGAVDRTGPAPLPGAWVPFRVGVSSGMSTGSLDSPSRWRRALRKA